MRTKILVGTIFAGFLAFAYGMSANTAPAVAQNNYKNLQVLDKNMSKKDLKKMMKEFSKALGVKCDFCHEQPAFEKDTEHKKFAREMIKMVQDNNKKYFKNSKKKITCNTCHMGNKEPQHF